MGRHKISDVKYDTENTDVMDQPFLTSKKVNTLSDKEIHGILKSTLKSTIGKSPGVIENPATVCRYKRTSGVEKIPGENFSPVEKTLNAQKAVFTPLSARREINDRSLYKFLQYFWNEISTDNFSPNWHIEYLCNELMFIARRVAQGFPKKHDLIINVPPGTTKTITCSTMFPVWCWSQWPWMKFITASYSARLSSESAEASRNLIRSEKFQMIYPELEIHEDKSAKSNYQIVIKKPSSNRVTRGGTRYSTSVGGTLRGFHGHIIIIDDPVKQEASGDRELENANYWMDSTLPTRKVDKAITATVLIMQRLHQDDPTGHILEKKKENIKHICLPGEIINYADKVKPVELIENYIDGMLDPKRLSHAILSEMEVDLGQYGYAGQVGQNPTPPGGGMFKVDHFIMMHEPLNPVNVIQTVRYWDKAATAGGTGPYTVGVRMSRVKGGRFVVEDVRRGRWGTEQREKIIQETARIDGPNVKIVVEQEPGSGGKESAEGTIRALAGYIVTADRPTGDKAFRADPYSVQVNNGNVSILPGEWNAVYIEEHRYFPVGTYKDQVDASSGCFNQLVGRKQGRMLSGGKR